VQRASVISLSTTDGRAQVGMKRHPTANRPLIDYKLALLLQPLSVAGTIIGFLLNTVSDSHVTAEVNV
jgi:hypothetical protein